jgi:membrane protein DedA with SNARE-associated domain
MVGSALPAFIAAHGLLLLFPLAVVEGPIVTVVAAWLAQQGLFDIRLVLVVATLGDLIGDTLYYLLGRHLNYVMPNRLRAWLGLSHDRIETLIGHFEEKGGQTLLFGKLTHVAGLPILVAAGTARMPYAAFLFYNLLGTLPKIAVFAALGWCFGSAWQRIDGGIFYASILATVVLTAFVIGRLRKV